MGISRFHDPISDKDGPVSGALQIIPIQFSEGATGTAYAQSMQFPAGQGFEIVAIDVQALGITSDPSITVGTAKAGAQIVAAVNASTALGSLTLVSTSVPEGGMLEVRVTNDAGDAFESIGVTVYGYLSAPPTSVRRY